MDFLFLNLYMYIGIIYYIVCNWLQSLSIILVYSYLLAVVNYIAINCHVQIFVWRYIFISFGHIPRNEMMGLMVILGLFFEELAGWFPKQLHHFIFPLAVDECSNFSTFLTKLISLFDSSHPCGCDVVFYWGFDLNFIED